MSKNKKQSAEAVPEEKTEAAGSEEKTEAEQPAAPEQDSKEAAEKQTEAVEKVFNSVSADLAGANGGNGAVIGGGNAAPASRYNGEGICFYG